MREIPYGHWRNYNPEETVRFYALRLQGGEDRRLSRVSAGTAGIARKEDRARHLQHPRRQALVAVFLLLGGRESRVRAQAPGGAEDTARFFALRLRDIGMLKGNPQKLLAQGTDWRFIDQLKKEMKT